MQGVLEGPPGSALAITLKAEGSASTRNQVALVLGSKVLAPGHLTILSTGVSGQPHWSSDQATWMLVTKKLAPLGIVFAF